MNTEELYKHLQTIVHKQRKSRIHTATRQEVITAREVVHTAIKEVIIKHRTFIQTLTPTERRGVRRRYTNADAFYHHLKGVLGTGAFSIVFEHPTNPALVVKLMCRNNDGAILWHSSVYDAMRRGKIIQGALQVYHIEDNPHGHGAWCILPKVSGFREYNCLDYGLNVAPVESEAVQLAQQLSNEYGFNYDLHGGNIAYHNGFWVLTDPLAYPCSIKHDKQHHVKAPKINTCTFKPCQGWNQ